MQNIKTKIIKIGVLLLVGVVGVVLWSDNNLQRYVGQRVKANIFDANDSCSGWDRVCLRADTSVQGASLSTNDIIGQTFKVNNQVEKPIISFYMSSGSGDKVTGTLLNGHCSNPNSAELGQVKANIESGDNAQWVNFIFLDLTLTVDNTYCLQLASDDVNAATGAYFSKNDYGGSRYRYFYHSSPDWFSTSNKDLAFRIKALETELECQEADGIWWPNEKGNDVCYNSTDFYLACGFSDYLNSCHINSDACESDPATNYSWSPVMFDGNSYNLCLTSLTRKSCYEDNLGMCGNFQTCTINGGVWRDDSCYSSCSMGSGSSNPCPDAHSCEISGGIWLRENSTCYAPGEFGLVCGLEDYGQAISCHNQTKCEEKKGVLASWPNPEPGLTPYKLCVGGSDANDYRKCYRGIAEYCPNYQSCIIVGGEWSSGTCLSTNIDNDGDGYTEIQGDCDDNNASIHPGATETGNLCGNGVDEDCSGQDLSCDEVDNDGDGFTENQGDCNDGAALFYPNAIEICGDGIDQDCNGSDLSCDEVDNDEDGYTEIQGDCDDNNASIHPGATESCDDADNDCNGQIDENVQQLYYQDNDRDGYGDDKQSKQACSTPDGYVRDHSDCDDNNDSINPNITEICGDGIDQDCNGSDLACVCDAKHPELCESKEDCPSIWVYDNGGQCVKTDETDGLCYEGQAYNCETQSTCSAAGETWYGNYCGNQASKCFAGDSDFCLRSDWCADAGFNWNYTIEDGWSCATSNGCQTDNLGACDSEDLCEDSGSGYWWEGDSSCRSENTCDFSLNPDACSSQNSCLTANRYWWQGQCYNDNNFCHTENLAACTQEGADKCYAAGGRWSSGRCVCTAGEFSRCTDESSCSLSGGYWWGGDDPYCIDIDSCNPSNPAGCLTDINCTSVAGGVWVFGNDPDNSNGQCVAADNTSGACQIDNPASCTIEQSCERAGHLWAYEDENGKCVDMDEADNYCHPDNRGACSEKACTLDSIGGKWFDNYCNEPDAEIKTGCYSLPNTTDEWHLIEHDFSAPGNKDVIIKGNYGMSTFLDFDFNIPTSKPRITLEKKYGSDNRYTFFLTELGGIQESAWQWQLREGSGEWEDLDTGKSIDHTFRVAGTYQIRARGLMPVTFHSNYRSGVEVVVIIDGPQFRITDEEDKDNEGGTSDTIMDQIRCEEKKGYVWLEDQCLQEKIPTKEIRKDDKFNFADLTADASIPEGRPVASVKFDPSQSVIMGQEISFQAGNSTDSESNSSGLEYSWSWDQRETGFTNWSTKASDTYVYDQPGTYTFVLKVRDRSGQIDSTIARINVTNPHHNRSTFTASPQSGTTKTVFTLEPTVWDALGTPRKDFLVRWDFDGNGTWDTDKEEPQTRQINFQPGSYLTRLLVINSSGVETIVKGYIQDGRNDGGRIRVKQHGSDPIHASFDIRPETGNTYTIFTFDAGDSLPVGFNYDRLGSSDYAFRWDWEGDGTWDTGWSKFPREQREFSNSGNFNVTLEVNKGGFLDTTTRELTVEKISHPHADFTTNISKGSQEQRHWEFDASPSTDAEDGDDLMYRWDFDQDGIWDTEWSKAKKTTHQFITPGHFSVLLEVRDTDLFTAQTEKSIEVYENEAPQAEFFVDVLQASRSHEFAFDASKTSDRHTPVFELQGRWDWEGDGQWDTDWINLGQKVFHHKYSETGPMTPILAVRDLEGVISEKEKTIWVSENKGPEVTLKVEPQRGFFSTDFSAVATAEDEETETNRIKYTFDWDYIDGDINLADKSKMSNNSAQHQYDTSGWHTVRVEAIDEEEMIGVAAAEIYIHPDSEYIDWLIDNNGTTHTTYEDFAPDGFITRAELLKMLYEVHAPDSLPFEPVQKDSSSPASKWEGAEITAEKVEGRQYRLTAPAGSDILSYSWDLDGNGSWDITGGTDNIVDFTYSRLGSYSIILDIQTTEGIRRLTKNLKVTLADETDSGEEENNSSTFESGVKIPFADVVYEDWFAPYVMAAYRDNIMLGFRDRHFRPDEPLSVIGALNSIFKMYDINPGTQIYHTFPDISSDRWYAPLASFAAENDIWSPNGTGNFRPQKALTRAEAARIIYLVEELGN